MLREGWAAVEPPTGFVTEEREPANQREKLTMQADPNHETLATERVTGLHSNNARTFSHKRPRR